MEIVNFLMEYVISQQDELISRVGGCIHRL